MTDTHKGRRRPGENRRRLVEAGLIEFGLYGYHGTSTGRIAARADVPQPHLYASFSSKRALMLACVADVVERLFALTEVSDASREDVLLLMQAIAVLPDPEVGSEISPLLQELSAVYAEDDFSALTQRGVRELLGSTSVHISAEVD